MGLLQAILLGLIALIITPGYLCYFDVTPKVVVLLLGTAALLLASGRITVSKRFSGLIFLNLASLALSTALSTKHGLSLLGTGWREFGLVPQAAALLFAWTVAGNPAGPARVILRGTAISGLAAGAYGIAQYFGWDPLLPAAAYHIGEGIWTIVRPPGTMGYVSYFAAWLAMAAFLSAALAEMESSAAWRRLAWAAAAVCGFSMVLTGTRAAMLGLAAGCAVWMWLRGVRVTRRLAVGVVLVALTGAAFYFSPAGWNLRSRSRWFAEDRTGGGRPLLWRDTLRMAGARPLLGFGPETFTAEFARFESPELARQRPDFEYESPHNMFLDALAAQGALGLIALTGLCVAGFMAGFRAREAGLTAALTAGIVSQQFSAMTVPTALLLYVICALLWRTHSACSVETHLDAEALRKASAVSTLHARVRAPQSAVALALIVFAVYLGVKDFYLAQTQNRLKAGDSSSAAAAYACYRRWLLPDEMAADIWYSRASLEVAQRTPNPAVRLQALTQAQTAAVRATQTADDPFNAWYNLAAFDALRGDSQAAERDLRRAIAARPNWFKPHWTLARLQLLEGRTSEAESEAALAVRLVAEGDSELIRTLTDVRAELHK